MTDQVFTQAPWTLKDLYEGFDDPKYEAAFKEVKAGKFFNDLCGLNKKNKLGLQNPTMEEVVQWLA